MASRRKPNWMRFPSQSAKKYVRIECAHVEGVATLTYLFLLEGKVLSILLL